MPIRQDNNFDSFFRKYADSPDSVVFFVGAGLSRPLFPAWGQVLTGLLNLVTDSGRLAYRRDELEALIQSGQDYLEIADALVDVLDRQAYRSFMEVQFGQNIDVARISPAYQRLFDLKPKLVLTTNYDRVPQEIAPNYLVFTHKQSSEALRAIEQGKRTVLKLHGEITDQDSLVLTRKDYNSIMHRDPSFQKLLSTVFGSRTVLFLGFSLTDPNLALALSSLHGIHDEAGITHYALMPHMSDFRAGIFERTYGVRIIRYKPGDPGHPEVAEFLGSLKAGAPARALYQSYSDDQHSVRLKKYDTFDPRGIINVTSSNQERIQEYKRCLLEASGECFISGTSMVHLVDDSRDILLRKVREGCNFRLLIMDPAWIKTNSHLLTFLRTAKARGRFHLEIQNSMAKIREMWRELSARQRSHLQLRTYRTLFPYIITGFDSNGDGKLVVEITDYMPEDSRPRFTLHTTSTPEGLFAQVKGKFDRLWDNSSLTKKVASR